MTSSMIIYENMFSLMDFELCIFKGAGYAGYLFACSYLFLIYHDRKLAKAVKLAVYP